MSGGYNIIPPQTQVALAPRGPFANSDPQPVSLGPHGEMLVSQLEGFYRMQSKYRQTFFAANQADTTWTVALAATFTGIVVSNPPTSKKNLSISKVGFVLNAAPAAIAPVGLFTGWLQTGITAHTTALSVYDGQKGTATTSGNALADGAATLVGTPVWRSWILGGFTAAALFATTPILIDIAGMIEIPPGGYIGIGALTVVHGMGSIEWAEVDP